MTSKGYTVVVTEKVKKILLRLPSSIASRIENSLLKLEENPRPPGSKKLKGRAGYRLRIGDYRVIYEIEDNILRVIVIDVGHRKRYLSIAFRPPYQSRSPGQFTSTFLHSKLFLWEVLS